MATHEVTLDTGNLGLTVRTAGHGRMLWQIDTSTPQDARDALPFELVQTFDGGRIGYASPRLGAAPGTPPRHISEVFNGALPAIGTLDHFTRRDDQTRQFGLRLPAPDNGEIILLLPRNVDAHDPG